MIKNKENIVICCPNCSKSSEIQIPNHIIEQKKPLITISIPNDLICEHSFQAFIDKDYRVRGYQKVDFELPQLNINVKAEPFEKQELLIEDSDDPLIDENNENPLKIIETIQSYLIGLFGTMGKEIVENSIIKICKLRDHFKKENLKQLISLIEKSLERKVNPSQALLIIKQLKATFSH